MKLKMRKNNNIFDEEQRVVNINYKNLDNPDVVRKRDLVKVLKEINKLEDPLGDILNKFIMMITCAVSIIILIKVW